MVEQIGDGPIEPRYVDVMKAIAEGLDKVLNGEAHHKDPETGFVLLVFPFHEYQGRCNYISNAERVDVLTLLKDQIRRFEET